MSLLVGDVNNSDMPFHELRHLDEKKKKRKDNKTETLPDFPGREKVKFGEVVEAPPKLSFSKVVTSPHGST